MPIPTTNGSDDVDLAELPPLDDDGEEGGAAAADDDAVGQDTADGDLDDATGENDALHPEDLDVDAGDGAWLGEASEAKDLDIGEVELDSVDGAGNETAAGEDDEPRAEDPTLGDAFASTGLDSGEEGPDGPDEELRDQDLPDLGDADDDEAASELTAGELPASDEPLGLGWAAHPWTRVGAPVPIASGVAVACIARGAFVAGGSESDRSQHEVTLQRVDLEGGCQALVAEGLTGCIRGLSVDGETVSIRTDRGDVFVGREGQAFEALGEVDRAAAVVTAADRVWVRTEAGTLLSAAPASQAPGVTGPRLVSRHPVGASVIALAGAGQGEVVALLVDPANRPSGLVRGLADGSLKKDAIVLGEDLAKFGAPLRGVMAACRARVAFATQWGVVCGEVEGGWRAFACGGPAVALAFVDGGETLLAAVYSEADDTTGLVRVGPDGLPRVAALLGATQADIDSDGKVCDLASDDARGVVWVVGGFGVAAFSTR